MMTNWTILALQSTVLLWIKVSGFVRLSANQCRTSRCFHEATTTTTPAGRVDNLDEWIEWSSDSLMQVYNQSLLELMMIDSFDQVHTHERYAVLSHGIQDDPIYCYSNVAARNVFQYTEDEIYQIPSRYSAPDGRDRQRRQEIMDDVSNSNLWIVPHGIRQRKDRSLFEFRDLILWNVYDPQGVRVGQSAVYDQDKVVNVSANA